MLCRALHVCARGAGSGPSSVAADGVLHPGTNSGAIPGDACRAGPSRGQCTVGDPGPVSLQGRAHAHGHRLASSQRTLDELGLVAPRDLGCTHACVCSPFLDRTSSSKRSEVSSGSRTMRSSSSRAELQSSRRQDEQDAHGRHGEDGAGSLLSLALALALSPTPEDLETTLPRECPTPTPAPCPVARHRGPLAPDHGTASGTACATPRARLVTPSALSRGGGSALTSTQTESTPTSNAMSAPAGA